MSMRHQASQTLLFWEPKYSIVKTYKNYCICVVFQGWSPQEGAKIGPRIDFGGLGIILGQAGTTFETFVDHGGSKSDQSGSNRAAGVPKGRLRAVEGKGRRQGWAP